MKLKAAFWRFAHKRYQSRKPLFLFELNAYLWAVLVALFAVPALFVDFPRHVPAGLVGTAIALGLFSAGIAHRRIRKEKAKGGDALYRKRINAEQATL